MKLKHTGPTGIVVFTSSLDEAPDNVYIQLILSRKHGELEILKLLSKNVQTDVMHVKKVTQLRLVRFGYQIKVFGEVQQQTS